eukprot:TRINITY_DN3404_c0_g2_i21.p1 TRINITY_DN3404_c0_g2~~TRINITY_DN3404_c0_g2_i21.p1  ORF type:complete len:406 (-),score=81.53 TRINITY_DN3404_c0_g2_i21:1102-2319(-)
MCRTEEGSWYLFETTPLMSTYLLAFVIGGFERVEGATKSGVKVSVYTPPNEMPEIEFCLEIAVRTLEFLEDYLGVPYCFPKLDLVAVHKMDAGAMENWGCIVAFKKFLTVERKYSRTIEMDYFMKIIVHEIAHMWYGNLVTMDWWARLWLNEGFARYMETFVLKHIYPSLGSEERFLCKVMEKAFDHDHSFCQRPVEMEYKNLNTKGIIFDSTVYNKGACLVRMLSDYVGSEETFRKAMQNYIKEYSYGNVVTADLWNECMKVSNLPIDQVMDSWVKNKGHPIVFVERDAKDPSMIVLTQRNYVRGLSIGALKDAEPGKWNIPVKIKGKGIEGFYVNLLPNEPSKTITIETLDATKWIFINADRVGFYRVHYSCELLDLLMQSFSELTHADRFGLLSDVCLCGSR